MEEVWSQILDNVKTRVPHQVFEAWLKPLRPAGPPSGGQMVLLTENDFSADWVRQRYGELLEGAAIQLLDRPLAFQFQVSPMPEAPVTTEAESASGTPLSTQDTTTPEPIIRIKPVAPERCGLDARYSFESLVVGECNQFVTQAATKVAETPAQAYNPLFIFGGVGLGKTHILQAIGNRALARHPGRRISYLSSEKFMTQWVNATRTNQTHPFKESLRNTDILLVDDIQFIAGKKSTQEEFFHTFDALYRDNKQIVLAADRFPSEIEHLDERLRSRFSWGLVWNIKAPDMETRIAILHTKASSEGILLDDDVARFLAQSIATNVRELEGALIRVAAFSSLSRRPITLELVKEALKDIIALPEKQTTIEYIQRTVCDFYKIRLADLCSTKRTRIFSHPRQIAMYLSKRLTRHSYPEIGQRFGGRNHTTVLYAVRQVTQRQTKDENLIADLRQLTGLLTT
jgi:chromosomal replication initiator protein